MTKIMKDEKYGRNEVAIVKPSLSVVCLSKCNEAIVLFCTSTDWIFLFLHFLLHLTHMFVRKTCS